MNPKLARALVVAACLAGLVAAFFAGRSQSADGSGTGAAPAVVMAVRDLARLDATSFHLEKVVEASDAQSHLWGLVEAKDALVLVAVGDVVAGVDLAKLRDQDVRIDAATRTVYLRLPAAEVTSSTLRTSERPMSTRARRTR